MTELGDDALQLLMLLDRVVFIRQLEAVFANTYPIFCYGTRTRQVLSEPTDIPMVLEQVLVDRALSSVVTFVAAGGFSDLFIFVI